MPAHAHAHSHAHCRTVRLTGFPADEHQLIADALGQAPAPGPAYLCLHAHSLQAPDISIVNGEDLQALSALAADSDANALIVGAVAMAFPHPRLERPIAPERLFGELATLARAAPAESHGERRRQPRLDLDLTDPAVHQASRRVPPTGAVLIVDKNGVLRERVASLLNLSSHGVEWTDSRLTAERLCEETPVAVVLINIASPALDPYALCAAIKAQPQGQRIAVVLLVGPTCTYDAARAQAAGLRGLLDKPVADRHLLNALQRLLSLPPG